MAVKGVDISDHNGDVNFSALKAAGVEFVIIKCGYGSDYPEQDDKEFFNSVRKAKAAGMPYGVYLYSYALSTAQAKSEAAHALRLLRQADKPAYGMWFDMEDADHYKERHGMPSNSQLVDICLTFLKRVEEAGYYTGLYANLDWMENRLNDPRLDRYDKWVAQWDTTCEYRKPYGIWQFTNSLEIGDNVFDGNWAYKDYPALTGTKKEEDDMSYEDFKDYMSKYEAEKAKKAASEWAETPLKFCKGKGIMTGDKDGSMRPLSPITRQEVAQVMFNFLGGGKDAHEYAKEAWEKAVAEGILDGSNPREPLTREQFAAVLDRLGLIPDLGNAAQSGGQEAGQTAAAPGA